MKRKIDDCFHIKQYEYAKNNYEENCFKEEFKAVIDKKTIKCAECKSVLCIKCSDYIVNKCIVCHRYVCKLCGYQYHSYACMECWNGFRRICCACLTGIETYNEPASVYLNFNFKKRLSYKCSICINDKCDIYIDLLPYDIKRLIYDMIKNDYNINILICYRDFFHIMFFIVIYVKCHS